MMERPVILTTCSNLDVEDTRALRLNHEYVNAVVKAGGVPMVAGSRFGLDELIRRCDGLLLPGGVDVDPARFGQAILNDTVSIDRERDELELDLIEKFWKTGKPVLAICRGLQIVNVAFGGSLIQDIPTWCGGTHGGGVRHEVTVGADCLLNRLTGARSLRVNSYHHQCVTPEGLAKAFVPTAVWTGCGVVMVEAFEQPGYPLLAVQWHPERACFDPEHLSDMAPLFSWLVEQARR